MRHLQPVACLALNQFEDPVCTLSLCLQRTMPLLLPKAGSFARHIDSIVSIFFWLSGPSSPSVLFGGSAALGAAAVVALATPPENPSIMRIGHFADLEQPLFKPVPVRPPAQGGGAWREGLNRWAEHQGIFSCVSLLSPEHAKMYICRGILHTPSTRKQKVGTGTVGFVLRFCAPQAQAFLL